MIELTRIPFVLPENCLWWGKTDIRNGIDGRWTGYSYADIDGNWYAGLNEKAAVEKHTAFRNEPFWLRLEVPNPAAS